MGQGPLAGVRLIEMDAIGPVPLAGMILSGLGADIVRIARAGSGVWADVGGAVLHRGRDQVVLDLKRDGDRQRLLDLVARADGLIEGARPGVMERLGVGPEVCLARNPRLVFARVTGWGQEGPLARTAGHDINYIAMTGALHAIGAEGAPPTVPLNLIGDYAGGTMFAALGIVSALLAAKGSGAGQVVDVAMVDGVANLLAMFHAFLATGSWVDRPASNLLDGAMPFYRCYMCRDGGAVAVGALEPQFFAELVRLLGFLPDRFAQHDRAGWPDMERAFTERFATRTRDEWAEALLGTDACVAPVLSLHEAMAHPVNVERRVFAAHGGVTQPMPAPRFSGTPGAIGVAREIGIDDAIAAWSPD